MTQTLTRAGVALAGLAGAVTLAGCGGQAAPSPSAEPVGYADGTYTASGNYQTPESIEHVSVTVTLAGGVVTAVEVVGDPQTGDSVKFQGMFIGGIADAVVGKQLDEISVRRVSGSSLTSGGFTQALETIKELASA